MPFKRLVRESPRHGPLRRWALAVGAVVSALTLVVASGGVASASAKSSHGKSGAAGKHFKIALSLSYSGNTWQNEAANLVKAVAKTPPYNKMVTLHEDIAGATVTKQIATLNNEIAAGYNAIIVYPISPTALNPTIEKACKAGITVLAYDSLVTAPCAYNAHIDQYQWGLYVAGWLAKYMSSHGDSHATIADITGVAGTTVDTDRQAALEHVLTKYPGITIAGEANGEWAQAQGLQAFQSIYSAHPTVKGVYAQAGCYAITQWLLSQHKTPLPCAGEFTNGHHLYMLPKAQGGVGLPSASAGSPAETGELDFIDAVKILEHKKVPHDIIVPLPQVTTTQFSANPGKLVGTDPAKGALAFPAKTEPQPGLFDDFWSPLVEEGLQAALHGKADKVSNPLPCTKVKGCKSQNKLKFRPSLKDYN